MFNVAVDIIGLDSLQNDWNAVVETIVQMTPEISMKVAREGLKELAAHIPKASGKLAKSGLVKLGRQTRHESYAEIRFTKQYASYSDKGAPPHVIRPGLGHGLEGPLRPGQKRRRSGPQREVLRFFQSGEERFASYVNHPGQAAQHWSDKADATIASLLVQEMTVAFERAAQRLRVRHELGLTV